MIYHKGRGFESRPRYMTTAATIGVDDITDALYIPHYTLQLDLDSLGHQNTSLKSQMNTIQLTVVK